jgi:hemoglobin
LEADVDAKVAIATPYSRIGEAVAIDRLVEAFYARMDALPQAKPIRDLHAANLSPTKEVLKRYLGEWLGGPPLYSHERGHPRLRMRQFGFKIGETERDLWMMCMRGALAEVVSDAALRQELDEKFYKLADWVRNQRGNPHDAASHGKM